MSKDIFLLLIGINIGIWSTILIDFIRLKMEDDDATE